MLITVPSVYLKDTETPKGMGVFAAKCFTTDEVIEICPTVVFNFDYSFLPEAFQKRVFAWARLAQAPAGSHAIALGYGSMYNHNNPANMRYEADPINHLLRFIAVKAIRVDEELTINYNAEGGGPVWENNNWFERNKIKPIVG